MGTPTDNKGYTLPAVGGDFGIWGSEVNGDLGIIDLNLGGVAYVNVAGNSNVVATTAQAQNLIHVLTGLLTGNIFYQLPAAGGMYIVVNQTTGAFTVTVSTVVTGSTLVVAQGATAFVFSDGTNILQAAYPVGSGAGPVTATSLSVTNNATIGGTLAVTGGTTLAAASTTGLTAAGNIVITSAGSLYLANSRAIAAANTAGAYMNMMFLDTANNVDICNAGSLIRFLNQAENVQLFSCDNSGNINALGQVAGGSIYSPGAAEFGSLYVPGATTLGSLSCNGNVGFPGGITPGGIYNIGGITGFDLYNNGGQALINFAGGMYIEQDGSNLDIVNATGAGFVHVGGGVSYGIGGHGYLAATIVGNVGTGTSGPFGLYVDNCIACLECDAFSDERLKTNIAQIPPQTGTAFVKAAKPSTFDKGGRPSAGFIAQDFLRSGYGNMVSITENKTLEAHVADDGFVSPEGSQFNITYDHTIAYLTAALQDALARIEILECGR